MQPVPRPTAQTAAVNVNVKADANANAVVDVSAYTPGEAANDPPPPRGWVVTTTWPSGRRREQLITAVASWDALDAARDAPEVEPSCRMVVRPLVELTDFEGHARHQTGRLHPQASAAARAGWARAEARALATDTQHAARKAAGTLQRLADHRLLVDQVRAEQQRGY